MGMFDRYVMTSTPRCDVCGEAMTECQGKDGPSILATWREGEARMSTSFRIDEPLESLDPLGLPARFTFSCWCPNDHRQDYIGECDDGVWSRAIRVLMART